MSQDIDFREVRRRAFRVYMQDGLWEIWIGVWFALFAGYILAYVLLGMQQATWISILVVIWPVFLQRAKKRLACPRIGQVSVQILSPGVRVGLVVILALIILAQVSVLLLGFAGQAGSPVRAMVENLSALEGMVLAGLFGYVGFRYGIIRYYAFAAVSLITGFGLLGISFDQWTTAPEIRWGMYAAVMAVVLVPSGLVLLIRFLRDNPVLEEETHDAEDRADPERANLSS